MSLSACLELSELSFRYSGNDIALLNGITLRCEPGRIYGLFGGNGSGKTSLLNLMTGLLTPESGQVLHYGSRIPSDAFRTASFGGGLTRTFQVPKVVDELSVRENLELAFREPGESFRALCSPVRRSSSISTRIEEYLAEFRLKNIADQPGATLSYGTRRLVSNVRALLTDARLVLMDEPFANLQPDQYQVLNRVLRHEAGKNLRTFIIVEHPPTHLAELADQIFFLHQGLLSEHPLVGDNEQKLRTVVDLLYEA